MGSISGQGTYLGFRFYPWFWVSPMPGSGMYRRQLMDVSLTLMFLSLPSFLSKSNEKMASGEDKKLVIYIQHPFMTKNSQQNGCRSNYLTLIKTMHDESTATVLVNNEKLKAFSLQSGTRQECPTLTSTTEYSIGSPSHNSRTKNIKIKEEKKRHPNWKKKVKLSHR